MLLFPEGHHLLRAPEALRGHRHRGDRAGRRHIALREESLEEEDLGYYRYFSAGPPSCDCMHFVF